MTIANCGLASLDNANAGVSTTLCFLQNANRQLAVGNRKCLGTPR